MDDGKQYIYTFSNHQPDLFPNNRANSYENELGPASALHLPLEDKWEMALGHFSTVNTIQSIPKDLQFYVTFKEKQVVTRRTKRSAPDNDTLVENEAPPTKSTVATEEPKKEAKIEHQTKDKIQIVKPQNEIEAKEVHIVHTEVAVTIPKGKYTAKALSDLMQAKVPQFKSKNILKFEAVREGDTGDIYRINLVVLNTDFFHTLTMDPFLADILGFKQHVFTATTQGALPIHVDSFAYNIVVICDLIEESIIGGSKDRILRVIPFRGTKYLKVFEYEPTQLDYQRITSNTVDKIHIELRTDTGELIPLEDGRTMVKLRLKRASK